MFYSRYSLRFFHCMQRRPGIKCHLLELGDTRNSTLSLTKLTARQCPNVTRNANEFSTGANLAGVTNSFAISTCAVGYTVGGFAGNATTLRFNCTGTAPAANTWFPAPFTSQTDCQGLCAYVRVVCLQNTSLCTCAFSLYASNPVSFFSYWLSRLW
jgi:hypothetical protein